MKDFINEANKTNSQKRDCTKDKKDVITMIEKLQKELLDLRDDHRSSKDRIRALELQVPQKAETKELAKVQEYLDLLPTKDEVVQLRSYLKNSIEKFTTDNKDFSSEFYQHMAIIRRYDEVLSDKASKHSIYETETRLNDLYKPKMKTLDERITINHKLITE